MKNYTLNELFDIMTAPSQRLTEDIKSINDNIMILGAGGKVGPSLAITAKRAFKAAGIDKEVYAVSLFDYPETVNIMKDAGVTVIEADLSDPAQLEKLPDVKNIIYMVGKKFGTTGNQSLTWYINVILPSKVAERFPDSNIVVFSSGNVYGMEPLYSGGATEEDELRPIGEYAQSCVGRERIMEYYSRKNNTPMLMFRLNYAIDLRYGVLYDIAKNVMDGTPVSLSQGVFNCIWQGDVCEYAIRSLLHTKTPPEILNVTSPEIYSVRYVANEFGKRFGKKPVFDGQEEYQALFSNTAKMVKLLGAPRVGLIEMIDMIADWMLNGGKAINAPTHFEVTDGKF
ncbi:MAG: NAD(P)-dependent oxidoreductase [Clostridiaceae bacterium]|nr:NAD(P)-dependent oxidoreductase [Clostridiaceae bacterium]